MDAEGMLDYLRQFDVQNRNVLLATFATFGVPGSLLDIGCGTGAMVETARVLGVDAHGVDIIHHDQPQYYHHDLNKPFQAGRRFDWIITLEVAEHLREESADHFCDAIADHLYDGGLLIFTAAVPGQNGIDHINLQPASYWRDKLYKRGLQYQSAMTWRLMVAWSVAKTSLHHLEANLQLFTK